MSRFDYCEFFRFKDGYCDVFIEDGHYLYAECETYEQPGTIACKEFTPAQNGSGYVVSCYCGACYEYLKGLTPAPESIALDIIASEERYTLEIMARDYGYSSQYVVDCYLECMADGYTPHEAFVYTASTMMEYDL